MANYEERTRQYKNGRKRIQILVKCAKCNKERWILKEYIKIKRANLCHKCACENNCKISGYKERINKDVNNNSIYQVRVQCPICGIWRWLEKGVVTKKKREGNWTGRCCRCTGKLMRMENSVAWKGGRNLNGGGYIRIKIDMNNEYFCMTSKDRYILEHRYIMAQKIGRPLTKFEHVHHLDGNKINNSVDNLILLDGATHWLVTKLEIEIKRLNKLLNLN